MSNKLRWIISFFAILSLLFFFLEAGVFLSSPAEAPQRADVIVILGGGTGDRVVRGIELYRKKFAPAVLLIGPEKIAPYKHYRERQAQILIAGGVKKEAIEFDTLSGNSWQEAENTYILAKARRWRKVIVVSDPPHMRRLKRVWGKKFKGTGIGIIPVQEQPLWWCAERWWETEQARKFVVSEHIKLLYYIIKY